MKANLCCHSEKRSERGSSPGAKVRKSAGWVIPSLTLALVPKCPVCLAAYITLATGIGISMRTAAFLRGGLIVSSVVLLAACAVRKIKKRIDSQ